MLLFIPVIGILVIIIYAVVTENKLLGSLIQMGELQRRNEVHLERVENTKKGTVLFQGSFSVSERLTFTIGLMNVILTAYFMGRWPTHFYLLYTPKALILISARWWDFRKRKQHWLLCDWCYIVNFACLLYVWVWPRWEALFQVIFVAANGPLAWSILAFNQALALHKWQHVTSVFIHTSPMLLTLGIRHMQQENSAVFSVCSDFPDCASVTWSSLLWNALSRFYIFWIVGYYVFVFVALGDYMKSRSFQTLYDRVAGNQLRSLFSAKYVSTLPDLVKKGVYMGTHVVFATLTMALATQLFHSALAHLAFVVCFMSMSAYNASAHYDAQFKRDAENQKTETTTKKN